MTLRNIEELQQQNQRLLAVVRELSDQREEQEKETLDEHTKVRQRLSLSLSVNTVHNLSIFLSFISGPSLTAGHGPEGDGRSAREEGTSEGDGGGHRQTEGHVSHSASPSHTPPPGVSAGEENRQCGTSYLL